MSISIINLPWIILNHCSVGETLHLLFFYSLSIYYSSRWGKTLCIELLGWRLQFLHWTFPCGDWWDSVQCGFTGYLYQWRMQGCSDFESRPDVHPELCTCVSHNFLNISTWMSNSLKHSSPPIEFLILPTPPLLSVNGTIIHQDVWPKSWRDSSFPKILYWLYLWGKSCFRHFSPLPTPPPAPSLM